MMININKCIAAGFSNEEIKKIKSIAKRISKAAREAENMHIQIFGGSCGELRFHDCDDKGYLKLATLEGWFDGGDGGDKDFGDGLLRGEDVNV